MARRRSTRRSSALLRRRRVPQVVAASDCERCRPGWVTQPANAASSLAYVAAGADLLRRPHPDRAFAWAVIGVGVGSVAYHGPGGVAGRWLHDTTLLALLGLLTVSDLTIAEGRPLPPGAVPAVALGAGAAAHPRTSELGQYVAGSLAVAAEARRYARGADRRELAASLPLWGAGLALHVRGRTGERWCRPDAIAQPHAAWHVLSAAALWSRRRL